MPLPQFFERLRRRPTASNPDATPPSSAELELARVRARRRLVGMVVLVGAGVIGFPWLFETQPRPMPPEVQVVSGAAGKTSPASPARIAAVAVPAIDKDEEVEETSPPGERSADPGRQAPKETPKETPKEPAREAPAKAAVAPKEAAKAASRGAVKDEAAGAAGRDAAPPSPKAATEASRARALLEGKAAEKTPPAGAPKSDAGASDANEASRYVVQVGAFADGPAVRELRLKVERLGIKTYTQAIGSGADKKVRVRVGPFASKAEADKTLAALRKAGLSGAVLTL